jgi:hypothetical protein
LCEKMKHEDYNLIPGDALALDWDELNTLFDTCYLVLLNRRQISHILSHLRFSHLTWIWGEPNLDEMNSAQKARWREIQSFCTEVEVCLQMGCELDGLLEKFDDVATILAEIRDRLGTGSTGEDIGSQIGLINGSLGSLVDLGGINTTIGSLLTIGTDISGLGDAISALQLSPTIEVQSATPGITVSPEVTCSPDVTLTCGSSGSTSLPTDGGTDGTITITPDPSTGAGDTSGDPPDGFNTWTAYNAYKCQVANFIVDSLIGGFNWFSGFSSLGIDVGVGGLAVWVSTLLTTIKNMSSFARLASYAFVGSEAELIFGYALVVIGGNPLAWIGIATALGTLLVLSIAAIEYCGEIATLIETNKQDVICDLYKSSDATEAGTVLRARVLGYVTTVVESWAVSIGETIGINTIMSVYDYIWNDNRMLNMLFECSTDFQAKATSYTPSCETCNPKATVSTRWDYSGNIISGEVKGGPVVVQSEHIDLGGWNWQGIELEWDVPVNVTITKSITTESCYETRDVWVSTDISTYIPNTNAIGLLRWYVNYPTPYQITVSWEIA